MDTEVRCSLHTRKKYTFATLGCNVDFWVIVLYRM